VSSSDVFVTRNVDPTLIKLLTRIYFARVWPAGRPPPPNPRLAHSPCLGGRCGGVAEEMAKWKKMTAGMGALSVATTAIVLATEEHHHPDPDAPVVSGGGNLRGRVIVTSFFFCCFFLLLSWCAMWPAECDARAAARERGWKHCFLPGSPPLLWWWWCVCVGGGVLGPCWHS